MIMPGRKPGSEDGYEENEIKWSDESQEHDYSAALSDLILIMDVGLQSRLSAMLRCLLQVDV
jgi:hypothetical protein